jgi:Mg2+-importing ATPase
MAMPSVRTLPSSPTNAAAVDALRRLAWLDAAAALLMLGAETGGLEAAEVERRRIRYGRNDVAHGKSARWYQQLAVAFANPFNVLLATLAVVSGITGGRSAVVVIGTMVLLSTVLRFVQEFRSKGAADALRALVRNRAAVRRSGDRASDPGSPAQHREVPIDDLVPGDIVFLSAGDMVPADVRLIATKDLFISQSSLTGESLPVEKSDHAAGPQAPCALTDLATICFMGSTVVSGTATAVVAATGTATSFGAMAQALVGRQVATAFDIGVGKVSWLFIRFIAVMVPLVVLLNGLTKHDWLEAVLFGLAIAVGLTPEMLPMIVTTNLAKGAVTMARKKTIVKRLSAIQNLGAMDVLCTDKTGTLTRDEIVLERYIDATGQPDPWVLSLAYLNSYYQTGLKNLLDVAVLAHGELEAALIADAARDKVDEIPFDFARRRMSVVVEQAQQHQLICKGAVEEVLAACTMVRSAGTPVPLDAAGAGAARAVAAALNQDGFRVVAVAYREFAPGHGAYSAADETALTLAGFISLLDPPKESAAPALAALATHGIQVKILTGDNELVSRKVCSDVGLQADRIVLGSELVGLDDGQLGELADRHVVFARLAPDDKVRIVRALRARGHTVGYLASTTLARCTRPTSEFRWTPRSTSPRSQQRSSCWRRA